MEREKVIDHINELLNRANARQLDLIRRIIESLVK